VTRRARSGFWRERLRGVGFVAVLLGGAILVAGTVIALLALVATP
jgi:hypothetical protein